MPKTVLSDEQLVQMIQNGFSELFGILAARYSAKIRATASFYRECGVETEDLKQEGLIGLFMAVRSYQNENSTSFRTYAWACIDRRMISAVRRALCKKQIPKQFIVSIEDFNTLCDKKEFSKEKANPESAFFIREDWLNLKKAITDSLSVFEQKVLAAYLIGESYGEIAGHLHSSAKAVDKALSRIRRKLRCKKNVTQA